MSQTVLLFGGALSLSLQVADTLLFAFKADEPLSSFAELVLDTCSAQGLPSTCHVVMVMCLNIAITQKP